MDQIDRQRMAVKRVIEDEVKKAIQATLEVDSEATNANAIGDSRHYIARRGRLVSGFHAACDRAVTLIVELEGTQAATRGAMLDSLLSEGQQLLQAHFDRGRSSAKAYGDQIAGQSETLKADLDEARAYALNDLQLGIVGGRRVPTMASPAATFDLESYLAEYDDATHDVSMSDDTTFGTNLARWFDLLEGTLAVAAPIRALEVQVDFPKWLDDNKGDDDLGGGTLRWPRGSQRLAMQLAAFRWMNADQDNYVKFYGQFNGSSGRYDDMVRDVVQQHFDPMARDLRRHLEKTVSKPSVGAIPASDRLVRLDHNHPDYQRAVASLDETLEAVRGFNDFADEEEKQNHLAEVGAMRRLLDAFTLARDVVMSLMHRGLQMLTEKFVETIVGAAALAAFALIGQFLGMW